MSYRDPIPFFTGREWPWHMRVDSVTKLDPNSAAICANFQTKLSGNPGPGPCTAAQAPIYVVGPEQEMMPVTVRYQHGSGGTVVDQIPIPAGAVVGGSSDAPLYVVQGDTVWELWIASYSVTPTVRWPGGTAVTGWSCWIDVQRKHILTDNPGYSRNVQDLNGNILEQPMWGIAGSKLSLGAGVIQLAELEQGYIGHTLDCTVTATNSQGSASQASNSSATVGNVVTTVPKVLKPLIDLVPLRRLSG